MLAAMIASALKKLHTSVRFRRRGNVEEQRAQKHDRFQRGRQIACMIYEYCRATGVFEAVQVPSDVILEKLYKSRLENSVHLQTLLALHDQETTRSKEPNYQQ